MNTKIGLDFLSDIRKCSDGFAISFARTNNTNECWKVVLSRKTIIDSDALDIAISLDNKDIFIHVIRERDYNPEKLINTCEFLFKNEPDVWATLFERDRVVVYLEDIEEDTLIEKFATIKSDSFWRYVEDIYPHIQLRIGKANPIFIENELTVEDLLAAAESIVPYTSKN